MSGILYLVATPIGNLEDITLRAIRILKEVDIIAAEDTRKTLRLLNHFEIKKPLTSFFRHNEGKKGDYIISCLLSGKNVALVSDAGTPAISDPGEELTAFAIENKIEVIPIPGAVAGISGLIVSGLTTKRFTFEGFIPMNKKNRRERLLELKDEFRTMVFYEAPHKLKYTLEDMYKAFGDRKIVLARELTKIHEEKIRGNFSDIIENIKDIPPRGEYVLIVEGAEKKGKETFFSEMTELEHLKYYIEQGIDKKEAIKKVAHDRGVAKNEIYKLDVKG